MRKLDLTGRRFGSMVVLEFAGHIGKKQDRAWLCKCDCGNTKIITGSNLLGGRSKSCGCAQKLAASETLKTHGFSNTRLYRVYKGMKSRCNNTNNPSFKSYGARGIRLCPEWNNDFLVFRSWALANGYQEDIDGLHCSIDRIDPNKGYSPDNCRWVTKETQANNTRRNSFITINGVRLTVSQWAEKAGTNKQTLYDTMYRFLDRLGISTHDLSSIDITFNRQ